MIQIDAEDFLDPNNWKPDSHEHRIYATDDLEVYVIVDAIDYPYLCQYKWTVHDRKKLARGFLYLKRTVQENTGPEGERYISPLSGRLVRNYKRIQRSRFIHQEIMERTGKRKPSPKHKEVDHRNSKTIDCRRKNLRWATRSEQISGANRSRGRVNRKLRANVPARRSHRPRGGDASV